MTDPDEDPKTDLGPRAAIAADILGYILAIAVITVMFLYSSAFK